MEDRFLEYELTFRDSEFNVGTSHVYAHSTEEATDIFTSNNLGYKVFSCEPTGASMDAKRRNKDADVYMAKIIDPYINKVVRSCLIVSATKERAIDELDKDEDFKYYWLREVELIPDAHIYDIRTFGLSNINDTSSKVIQVQQGTLVSTGDAPSTDELGLVKKTEVNLKVVKEGIYTKKFYTLRRKGDTAWLEKQKHLSI